MTEGDATDPVELPHSEVLVMPADHRGDLDLARLIGRTLIPAARTLGIAHEGVGFDELCRLVITTAAVNPKGPLDSATFKAALEIRAVLTPRAQGAR